METEAASWEQQKQQKTLKEKTMKAVPEGRGDDEPAENGGPEERCVEVHH